MFSGLVLVNAVAAELLWFDVTSIELLPEVVLKGESILLPSSSLSLKGLEESSCELGR